MRHPGGHWCRTHCQSPQPVSPATTNTSVPASETSGSVLVDKKFRRPDRDPVAEWCAFVSVCVRACSHRESKCDGMACKYPSVKAFIRINRMPRLCVCDSTKDSLAVPGFDFGPRRARGVTDVYVRLPAVFLFELSLLGRGVPGICGG